MKNKIIIVLFFVITVSLFCAQSAYSASWYEEKGDHFIVQYSPKSNSSFAQKVLRRAEVFYDKLASDLGFSRYDNFWTWDERTKIIIYPDSDTFIKETAFPEWSKAGALRDLRLFETRIIFSFKQEEGFLDGVLPHEISHLILRDFVGSGKNIPVWLDEGIAQFYEQLKNEKARKAMKSLARTGKHIPFEKFVNYDIRLEEEALNVYVFYAQSLSVVDFMIKKYGSSKFGLLCRYLRDGKNFEEALSSAYISTIDSVPELEKKWLKYIVN